jgi:hypothetical protein
VRKFRFQLDTVLAWRRSQLEVEEAKLQALIAELDAIRAARIRIDEALTKERRRIQGPEAVQVERVALDSFTRWVRIEHERLSRALADCKCRIGAQRAQLLQARRRYELLQKLKLRQQAGWQRACDKELEDFAAEAFLGRFGRSGS